MTGQDITLGAADPMRIALYAVALDLYQLEQHVDRAGKQDLLKYSYGEFLDNLAANRSVNRRAATAASTTVRFTASEVKTYALPIPEGTRVTNGAGLFFKTALYAEIAPGDTYADVECICTAAGAEANDFLPGQIDTLVDPLPYIQSVANTTVTAGGAATESDESLAERVYLAPSSYSTAGPADAYTFWAMCKTICDNMLKAMPATWQNIIVGAKKWTDNTGGGTDTAGNVTQDSSAKVWLLSEFEVQGKRSYANSAEQNHQLQYAYYANGNNKIRKRHDQTGTACYWWLRSPAYNVSYSFCITYTGGSATINNAYNSYGFAPGFRVA